MEPEADNLVFILNHSAQSVAMMELGDEQRFRLPCCEKLYDAIMNEDPRLTITISQNSPQWHKARQYRITGSRCYEIYTYCGTDWQMKSKKYFWPKSFSNKYTRHGLKYENVARAAYITKTGNTVRECGMITVNSNKWLGFSPDGIVVENDHPVVLLEIKCLYAGE